MRLGVRPSAPVACASLGSFASCYEHRWTPALGWCDSLSVVYVLGIIILHYYHLLADGIVALLGMYGLSVVHCYQLLSEESILVEHVEFITCALLLSSIK